MKKKSFAIVSVLAFSVLAWGLTTMRQVSIVQSTINSTPIGQSSPSSASFTNINANTVNAANFSGSLNGNATTASGLANTPGQCGGGQFSTGIQPSGAANCAANPTTTRTCNGNGCYTLTPDGTIHAFGSSAASFSGSTVGFATVTLPATFSNNLVVTVTPTQPPNGNNDNMSHYVTSKSATSLSVVFRCGTNIGGSGCGSFTGSVGFDWTADGF